MSTLKDFTSSITQPLTGEIVSSLVAQGTPTGFLPVDGAVYAQATYPDLYSALGLIANGNLLTTWTTVSSGSNQNLVSIIYTDKYLVCGPNGTLRYSTSGATWTAATVTPSISASLKGLAYNGSSTYLVISDQGGAPSDPTYATSTDGITWTSYTTDILTNEPTSVTYGGGLFVVGGLAGTLATSTNGTTWTTRTSGTSSAIRGLTYGNSLYVMVGDGGMVRTSTDAITWTARTSGTSSVLNDVIYGGGYYVAVGAGGTILTATDAITWAARSSGVTANLNAVVYDGTFYTVGGQSGIAVVSRDLSAWDAAFATTTINALTYNASSTNPLVYGAGDGGNIFYASPYTYNPSTSFAVPTSNVTITGLDLFIKT